MDYAGAPQHIAPLAILEGVPSLAVIKKKVSSLLPEFHRLNSIFNDHPFPTEAIDINFKLEENIFQTFMGGDIETLMSHAATILMKPFPEQKPTWELHIIAPITKEYSILLFKLHHALGDGISALYFFHRLLGLPKQKERETKTEQMDSIASTIPFIFGELLKNKAPLPFYGKQSQKRKLLLYAAPNNKMQEIKRSYSCTTFSIVLALVSKVLSPYIQTKHHIKPFRALIPVTMRGKNNILDLGNEIGGASLEIPLGDFSTADLIEKINLSLGRVLKKRAYAAYHLCAHIFSKFPLKIQSQLCSLAATKLNGICTFLQAPSSLLSIDSCDVIHEFGIPALLPKHGISFGFVKYREYTNIAIIIDPEVIQDHTKLDSSTKKALETLLEQYKSGTALAYK